MSSYRKFLEGKRRGGDLHGFEPLWLPDFLFPFQRHLVDWAVRKGRSAIFADCGVGKSPMQLSWAENIVRKTNGNVLVLTPLAVSPQTVREGEKFGIKVKQTRKGTVNKGINVTNYERLEYFDSKDFSGIVCDESSVLKNFAGKRRRQINDFMQKVRYRLLCTATPSPNDYMELGTSSEALGQMNRGQMLGMFFTNGGKSTQQWELKGHARKRFWRWMCQWSRALRKPSDLGFSDDGFILPKLTVEQHVVESPMPKNGFFYTARTLEEQRAERKATLKERCRKVADVIPKDDFSLVWCLPPNEPVVMADGTDRAIATITVGDTVMSGSGNPRLVSRVLCREHCGDLISVWVRGVSRPIRLTPEHRLPVLDKWKQAGQLVVGDRLIEPRISMVAGGDYRQGWIVGMYAAQGSRVRGPQGKWNRVAFTTHQRKAGELATAVSEFLGREPQIRHQGKRDSIALAVDVQISDPMLRNLVDAWVDGDRAPFKKLARFPSESDFARGVLDGWLAGDGSIVNSGRRREGQTSSPGLARQMSLIAGSLGCATWMAIGRNRPGPSARSGGSGTQTPHDWHRVGVSEGTGHYSQPLIEPDRILREVVRIEAVPYSGLVFDLTVDTDHTFLTRGIVVSNCHLNAEGDLLEKLIPEAVQVTGSARDEDKEERLSAFAAGQIRVLVTKPKIAGFGLNLQHCNHMTMFPSHSYESYYQAVRRCWRFGQTRPVKVDIITSEGESRVMANMRRKDKAASEMFSALVSEMNEYQLSNVIDAPEMKMEVPSWLK